MACVTRASGTEAKLHIARGAKLAVRLVVKDPLGAPIDLTGASIWLTVRNRTDDVAAVIQKRSTAAGGDGTQVEIMDQIAYPGQCRVHLLGTDTRNLRYDASYWYDAFVTLGSDGPYQLVPRSEFVILPSITRF